MKRPHRSEEDGKYHIKGKTFPELFGSRAQVFRGNAFKTLGNLTKDALLMNKHGRIVSKKKFYTAKKEKRLLKHGYGFEKGKFGFKRVSTRKNRKTGGSSSLLEPSSLAPSPYSSTPASATVEPTK